jgi:putative flippase GtrA
MDLDGRKDRGLLLEQRRVVKEHFKRLFHFACVSGAGLALDLFLFLALLSFQSPPYAANIASSCAAVTFVYFASVRRVFRYDGRFHVRMFAAYVAYQACGIAAGSWAVQSFVLAGVPGAAAKLAIVPATFTANYVFMWGLTANPQRWSARARP